MHITKPFERGDTPELIRRLSFDERRQVLHLLRDPAMAPPEFLQGIHDEGNWLACDCRQDTEVALLHTRRAASGHLSVVRMHSRPQHKAGCAFAEGLTDHYAPGDDNHALEVWLLDLAEQAGTDHLSGAHSTWAGLGEMVRAASQRPTPLGPAPGRFVIGHVTALPRLAVQMREKAKDGGVKPLGYLLAVAGGVTREGVVVRGTRDQPDVLVPVRGPVQDFDWGDADEQQQAIAAFLIRAGTDGRYEPVAALRVPCARWGTPVLIPSLQSARAIGVARRVARRLHEHGVQVRARYPGGLAAPVEMTFATKCREVTVRGAKATEGTGLFVLPARERPPELRDEEAYADMLASAVRRRLVG